jgi:putative acetyltransferase
VQPEPCDIYDEAAADHAAVRRVHAAAFGRPDEGALVDALRAEGCVVASLVGRVDEVVVGHILFSDLPITTAAGTLRGVALAPLAVLPDHQRQGVGRALVRAGLSRCTALGVDVAVVLGHPAYYARFGFTAALAARLRAPYAGDAFMAFELRPDALRGGEGTVRYAAPFSRLPG